jgi:hypothetical protein
LFGCIAGNDVSSFFEATAVERHEAKRAAQLRYFFHVWMCE